jgi:hypothetical protein
MISIGSMAEQKGVAPLSANGDAGMSHVTASAPPEGGAIIDLNISATAPPSPTPATTDASPNGLQIHSPPPNPNLMGHHRVYPR